MIYEGKFGVEQHRVGWVGFWDSGFRFGPSRNPSRCGARGLPFRYKHQASSQSRLIKRKKDVIDFSGVEARVMFLEFIAK